MGDDKPGKDNSVFWWASIAGADCEPVEVVEDKRLGSVVYTCGCADPFVLDTADCPVLLVQEMKRALTPKQNEAEMKLRLAHNAKHGWRGPR